MNSFFRRLAYLLGRRRDAELAEELEFHRAARQKAFAADGMSPLDAEALSRRAMGIVTLAREDARAVWITPWIESVWQDVAYALRSLVRERAFTFLAVGALTAGIGLNSSLFTV